MARKAHPVSHHLIGEAQTATLPGSDPALYGTARLDGPEVVEVRSYQTYRVTYTVGKLGIDDTGAIRVAFRVISDAGPLQTANPAAPNYVTARSNGEGQLQLRYDKNGGQRPWNETLTVYQSGGYLKAGETIEIVFGDTSGGSPGLLMPTFHDGGREFRVFADVQATGNFIALPDTQLAIAVVAGPVHRHVAVLPTLRRVGEPFVFGLKAEDLWGNPTPKGAARFRVTPSIPVAGLPEVIDFAPESGAMAIEGCTVAAPGVLRITLTDEASGTTIHAGPLHIREGGIAHYWGDLHGQTGETVGTNTAEHYFDFARNKAYLDVSSHQANDFQITAAFWERLNALTAERNEPGRFTVLPGYEWSGNTAIGGDHNVFYKAEGAAIHRSSHALLTDRSDEASDAHTLTDLYAHLHHESVDATMYAHVGGRYANIHFDHDPRLEAAVEVHSAWGTFEWILTDGFPMRRRVGVVCNSDGHKGRPGASFPGASVFGAYGGLTCFLMEENTRDSVFETIRRRHTYGTSGPRLLVELAAEIPGGGTLFLRNPDSEPDAPRHDVTACTMGDIVQTASNEVRLAVVVDAPVGIERIDVLAGTEVVHAWQAYDAADLGNRIRVMWSGAEYRGRGRNTVWRGRARFDGATIGGFRPINRLNPELDFRTVGSEQVVFQSVTTGNRMGFEVDLDGIAGIAAEIDTNRGTLAAPLDELGVAPAVLEAGGLERRLWLQRLPDAPLAQNATLHCTVPIAAEGDTPVWLRITLEDGNQAWTSPIYLFR
ncbi:MAG: DUF3604 domain-containing protein [Acuticoccus sp.]